MRGFIGLTKRNLLIYFKDMGAVVFSLLTSIIVFVLYLVFLKGSYVSEIQSVMRGLEDFIDAKDIDSMVSAILLVGIIGSAMITVPFSSLQAIIRDKENKIDYDISSTPIKRYQIILAYFFAAVISSFLVTGVLLTVGLLVISGQGGLYMGVVTIAKSYGIVLLGSVSSTALFLILALFFKTSGASSAFFGILSAASGFVIGAYLPLSQFSETVQTVCNAFPATQITVLVRNNLLNGILDKINNDLGGIDGGMFVSEFKSGFNFESVLFGNVLSVENMLLYVFAVLLLSLTVLVWIYSKSYKRN